MGIRFITQFSDDTKDFTKLSIVDDTVRLLRRDKDSTPDSNMNWYVDFHDLKITFGEDLRPFKIEIQYED
jgi:ppGpp synthetase/RelA/SpoT-type nucleotidyltranferase